MVSALETLILYTAFDVCFQFQLAPLHPGTVAAEFAAVFGASDDLKVSEFPRGGSEEITNALVRGLEKHGGEVRLRTHVQNIVVENGVAVGAKVRGGGVVRAPVAGAYTRPLFSST
jgi:phytoene dehydrogenase-like protein